MFGFINSLATLKSKLIALSVSFGIGASSAVVAGVYIHNWRVDSLRAGWSAEKDSAIEAAKTETQKVCDENNRVTKERSHALQTSLNSITDRYVSLRAKAGSSARAKPSSSAAGRDDGSAGTDLPAVQVPVVDGLDAGRLNDQQAARLIACQDVVADIYKSLGQADLLPKEYQ